MKSQGQKSKEVPATSSLQSQPKCVPSPSLQKLKQGAQSSVLNTPLT